MRSLLVFFLFASIGSVLQTAKAQNAVPVFSNVVAYTDSNNHQLRVYYDVNDAENDDMEVFLRVSSNDTSFTVDVSTAYGDLGFPITSGTGYLALWNYGAGFESTINSCRIRMIADDGIDFDIQDLVDQVDSMNLINDLTWLQGIRHHTGNPTHWLATRDSIHNRFESFGLETWNHDFAFSGIAGANVVSRHPGCTNEWATIINDAHYDGIANGPAADDNGSGVVGFLEAARILSQYQFAKNLRFIGFDLEEAGLVGSARYVNSGGIQNWETIEAVLNYEMIGYYSDNDSTQIFPAGFNQLFPDAYDSMVVANWKGNFLANIANVPSQSLRETFDSAALAYVPELRVISLATPGTGILTSDLRRSDHARFWDAGIPALMLTDGAEFRNSNYHTPNDVMDSLNFTFMANNVKATLATMATLAEPMHCGVFDVVPTINPETAIAIVEEKTCLPVGSGQPIRAGRTHRIDFTKCGQVVSAQLFSNTGALIQSTEKTNNFALPALAAGTYTLVYRLKGESVPRNLRLVVVR